MKINQYRQAMKYLTREVRDPTPRVDMKLGTAAFESSLPEKQTRKPKALPPKTNRVKMSKGNLVKQKKIMFNPATDQFENMDPDVYQIEKRLNAEALTFDPDLGKFVNKRTGKTGSLSDFKEELGEFSKMFKNKLERDKKLAKKNGDPKPNGEDPNPNVIPFPFDQANEKPWYESYLLEMLEEKKKPRDPILDMSVQDYMQMKEREYQAKLNAEALKKGIGKLLK